VHLLYEEDGELKAGTVLEHSPAFFHVQSPHGRRSKIKAANVLIAFERPEPAVLLDEAESFSRGLETDFLWECSGAREFGFEELAREYVGREPTPTEAAGVLMKLHSAPMYFYRRGRGRFQAAPEATLKLALAAVEKKKRMQEQVGVWAEKLAGGQCPAEVAELKDELLYAPDRNKPQTRALEQACAKTGCRVREKTCRVRPSRPSASTTSERPKSTMRFRCSALRPEPASVSISRRRGSASPRARRSTPSRGSAFRPRTCLGASSPCCPTT